MDTTFRFMKSGSEPETQSVLSFVEEENLLASSSCTLVVPRRPIALSGYRTKVFPTLSERDIRDHVIQGELLQLLLVVTFPTSFIESVAYERAISRNHDSSTTTAASSSSSSSSSSSMSSSKAITEFCSFLQGPFRATVDLFRHLRIDVQFAEMRLQRHSAGLGGSTTLGGSSVGISSSSGTLPLSLSSSASSSTPLLSSSVEQSLSLPITGYPVHSLTNVKLLDPEPAHKYCLFAGDNSSEYDIDSPLVNASDDASPSSADSSTSDDNNHMARLPPAPFIVLSNGSIAYPILVDAVVCDKFVNTQVQVSASITTPPFPHISGCGIAANKFDFLLRTQASAKVITTSTVTRVYQPLSFSTKSVTLDRKQFITTVIENSSSFTVVIHDIQLQTQHSEREPNRDSETHLEKGVMPVELYPGDRYHALVSVMPRYRGGNGGVGAGHAEAPALRQVPTTKSALLVMWNTEHLIGRVASEYELQWSTEHPKDLLVNVSVISPAPPNCTFNIAFAITNLSTTQRRLRLILDTAHITSDRSAHDVVESTTANGSLATSTTTKLAPLICQERSVRIGNVSSGSSVTVQVPFIALEEGLFTIEGLLMIDERTNQSFQLRNSCQVYIQNDALPTHTAELGVR